MIREVHMTVLLKHILKIPIMSLTNIIPFVRYFGLLKPFARKNRKNSAKPEEFIPETLPDIAKQTILISHAEAKASG
ncbi:MAG: hypothetical protein ACFWTN_05680 [Clostridium sp.]|jgi:hypothetical protein